MESDLSQEQNDAIAQVLKSQSKKKLVLAGPGAGKTTLFKRLLEGTPGGADQRLVLTFIGVLKADLEQSLGEMARVSTLHGYCQYLLHNDPELRGGLSGDFICYPGLRSIIKFDWMWLREIGAPQFVALMRKLECSSDETEFHDRRSHFYDAVDFDDSVYRVFRAFNRDSSRVPSFELALIDEFQDFNSLEAGVIEQLASHSPIVVAGDDDQALYSQLRDASWDHIRRHYRGGQFETFHLPFCMRCPEVLVDAVNDVIARARTAKRLEGRIEKPFRYFPPAKAKDSERFPKIDFVRTSVQSTKANYFGRYVAELFRGIEPGDLEEAKARNEPALLIIGNRPYLPQIAGYLEAEGLFTRGDEIDEQPLETGLRILRSKAESNLGWRIVLGASDPKLARTCVREAEDRGCSLIEVVPEQQRENFLKQAAELTEWTTPEVDIAWNPIKLSSYESAKGLSASFVVLVGVHEGELPRRDDNIRDIEICKFLVGLTRTKKRCTILNTDRFGQAERRPSIFLQWIDRKRFDVRYVGAAYWKAK
jgi:superfamily I DNA/RNA helicase